MPFTNESNEPRFTEAKANSGGSMQRSNTLAIFHDAAAFVYTLAHYSAEGLTRAHDHQTRYECSWQCISGRCSTPTRPLTINTTHIAPICFTTCDTFSSRISNSGVSVKEMQMRVQRNQHLSTKAFIGTSNSMVRGAVVGTQSEI